MKSGNSVSGSAAAGSGESGICCALSRRLSNWAATASLRRLYARRSRPRSVSIWAYDGTPSLCAPPRLYNQIAMQIADQMALDAIELARLLALVNTAMADAGIAIWESKYYYELLATGHRDSGSRCGDGQLAKETVIQRRLEIRIQSARRAREQSDRTQLHAAFPRISLRPCRFWRRPVRDLAQISMAKTAFNLRSSRMSSTV